MKVTGRAQVWDTTTAAEIGEVIAGNIQSGRFCPDGPRVLSISETNTARILNALSGKQIGNSMRFEGKIASAQFSPDGQRVLTISEDSTARIWDALSGKQIGDPVRYKAS
jgi:WD40 repeat protein